MKRNKKRYSYHEIGLGIKHIFYNSIASVVMYTFIIVTIIPTIALCIYIYTYLSNNIRADYTDTANQVISGVDKNLEIYFNEIRKTTDGIFAAEDVQELLGGVMSAGEIAGENLERQSSVSANLFETYGGRGDIACVGLYSMEGDLICESNLTNLKKLYPDNQSVFEELKDTHGAFTVIGTRYQVSRSGYHKNIITVGRIIKNLETGQDIGYMLIDIDYGMFKRMIAMSKNKNLGVLLITDENDIVLYNSEQDQGILTNYYETETYRKIVDKKNSQEVVCTSMSLPWEYHMLSAGEDMLYELNKVARQTIIVGMLMFGVFLFMSILISRSVTKPIKRLEAAMERAEANHFNEIIPAFDTYGEVNRLTRRYNVMLVEIRRLLEKEKELHQKQAETEYKALQMQITPHFLYNSLDSISCLAQIHNEPEISEMVIGLADIFKYNIKYDFALVTLRDEIKHVQNYGLVQALRYQDCFEIIYDVKDEDLEHKVTKFMLQPLVENAINHGMKDVSENGKIIISAMRWDDFFVVCVSDNGAGMDKETEEKVHALLNQSSEDMFEHQKEEQHIGLLNVNLRLKLQYGERAGMDFRSQKGRGTVMYIKIPDIQ